MAQPAAIAANSIEDPALAAAEAQYFAAKRARAWRRRAMPAVGVVTLIAVWFALVEILKVKPFIAPSPQAVLHTLVDKFGAQTMAHSFVIDGKGIVRYSGAVNDDPDGKKGDKAAPQLKNALDAVLAGKDAPASTTTPGGPAIKKESAKPVDAKAPPAKGAAK